MQARDAARKRRLGDATFQPLITASSWANVYDAAWDAAKRAHGLVTAASGWTGRPAQAPPGMLIAGTVAPRITNGEAVTLIRSFRGATAGTAVRFALWYAYAAIAYGWDPPDTDELDATALRAASSYVPDVAVALWMELHRIARELDDSHEPARLDLVDDFTGVDFVAALRAELRSDGAEAMFKLPMPWCIDKATGKRRAPRPPCDSDGQPPVDPITRKRFKNCDRPGDCEVETIDDPITAVLKKAWPLVAVVVAIWLFADNQPRRARRYRDN